jgi:PH domain
MPRHSALQRAAVSHPPAPSQKAAVLPQMLQDIRDLERKLVESERTNERLRRQRDSYKALYRKTVEKTDSQSPQAVSHIHTHTLSNTTTHDAAAAAAAAAAGSAAVQEVIQLRTQLAQRDKNMAQQAQLIQRLLGQLQRAKSATMIQPLPSTAMHSARSGTTSESWADLDMDVASSRSVSSFSTCTNDDSSVKIQKRRSPELQQLDASMQKLDISDALRTGFLQIRTRSKQHARCWKKRFMVLTKSQLTLWASEQDWLRYLQYLAEVTVEPENGPEGVVYLNHANVTLMSIEQAFRPWCFTVECIAYARKGKFSPNPKSLLFAAENGTDRAEWVTAVQDICSNITDQRVSNVAAYAKELGSHELRIRTEDMGSEDEDRNVLHGAVKIGNTSYEAPAPSVQPSPSGIAFDEMEKGMSACEDDRDHTESNGWTQSSRKVDHPFSRANASAKSKSSNTSHKKSPTKWIRSVFGV